MKKENVCVFFLIAFSVLVADQITKYFVHAKLKLFETVEVLPFFNLVYVSNTGSAFGMMKGLGNAFFMAIAAAAIVIVAILVIKYRDDRFALSLIMGGAAGNLTDRIARGYVVDFLDFFAGRHHWPAFNVADSALTVGITLLLINAVIKSKDSSGREG